MMFNNMLFFFISSINNVHLYFGEVVTENGG